MSEPLVQILDGNTFVVSDARGDIEASPTDPTGLFSFDTRFLSKWILTIDGERLNALSTDDLQYFEAKFFLVPGTGTVYVDAKLSVMRRRAVGNGFHEELTILNHGDEPVALDVRVDAVSDFADLFEVKDALKKKGVLKHRVEDGRLVLGYERGAFVRETWISATEPASIDDDGLSFAVTIGPHGEWTTDLLVVTAVTAAGDRHDRPKYGRRSRLPRPDMAQNLDTWLDAAPRLECDWESLTDAYRRSLVDLAALRFTTRTMPGHALPAAGLPWFMTMFGRDSIFTSLQALPFAPELAATTLRALGERQGTRVDDFRDEDPGRILHEMRYGEMAAFEERPHSPYYGTADATPLFVVLLDEYERWTGDTELVRDLEFEARAALRWIDDYADSRAMATSPTSDATRRPGSRTSAGRTRGTRSRTTMAPSPASRGRRASCRDTPTTPRCGPPGWRVGSGGTPRLRTPSISRRPHSSAASTATSGSRTVASSPWLSTPTGGRSIR
jgi:glycogen debranching enzyme